jgi:hypothetical protein
MTRPDQSHIRALMRATHPFLPGKYPGRPTPQHVLNSFVYTRYGRADGADAIRLLSRDYRRQGEDHRSVDELRQHPAVAGRGWTEDATALSGLSATILALFDPDGQIFPTEGSPLPIDAQAASHDRSDDGLGRALWRVIPRERGHVAGQLQELLDSTRSDDAASRLAQVLLQPQPRELVEADIASIDDHPLGSVLVDVLLMPLLGDAPTGARRLARIRQLATTLYFAATMGMLLEGIRGSGDDQPLGLVVYAGLPPGRTGDTLVQAAQRSYRAAAADAYDGYRAQFVARITRRLDEDVPAAIRLETALRDLLAESLPQNRVDAAAALLTPEAPPGEPAEWAEQTFNTVYGLPHLSRSMRLMGTKAGFVGPMRGTGQPRFVMETPLLAILTRAVLDDEDSIPFGDFVDRLRDRLGLIVGFGGGAALPSRARVFPSAQVAETQLRQMERLLRHRMVQAGLAREFSDSHTRVFRRA